MLPTTPPPTTTATSIVCPLNSLPDEIFELIVKHAADYNDGHIPLHSWHLTAVNQRFRQVMYSLVTRVVLTSSTTGPGLNCMPATHFVSRVLPNCRRLRHLSVEACHTLDDRTIGTFLRSGVKLKSFSVRICQKQTWRLLEDLCLRAKPSTLVLYGCNRDRHDYNHRSLSNTTSNRRRTTFHPCAVLHDHVMKHLVKYIPLKHITLNHALSLTDDSLYALSTSHTLTSITLQRLTSITDFGIIRLVDGKSKLKILCLQSCAMLTDESLRAISTGRSTKRLQTLKLIHLARITAQGVQLVVRSCKTLSSVRVDRCSSITNFAWTQQDDPGDEERSVKLSEIVFRGSLVTLSHRSEAYSLCRLGGNHLRCLDLSFISGLNAIMLSIIRLCAPLLSRVVLHASSHIDDSCMLELSQFQHLSHVDISHCSGVSVDAICGLVWSSASKATALQCLVIGPQSTDGPFDNKAVMIRVLRACSSKSSAPTTRNLTAANWTSSCNLRLNVSKVKLCGKVDEQFLQWMKRHCRAVVEVSHLVTASQKQCHSAPNSSTMSDITNSNNALGAGSASSSSSPYLV